MKVAILVNGYYGNYNFCNDLNEYDTIICADNGLFHADYLGIEPDYIIGDFDSLNKELLLKYEHVSKKTLSIQKDETDTEAAVDYAISLGATEIVVYGGIGSRFDHSFANVSLLVKLATLGIKSSIKNAHNTIYLVINKINIHSNKDTLVSLLPLSEKVTGVATTGLYYSLNNGSFELGKPYGISNFMTKNSATISLKTGKLLVILAID
ncbi:thiamine diphosphokinase [Candidatus Epulonipiscium viviparus]|uniref:thiamine diphosphokinase n=1 Tax=Candidatus Epulonipiscium viviparus TaxID=420336 RepID=UPI00273813EC|nr:thiamine diphosphokinase [Candidatus Epulopiscium viviparus]